MLVQEYRHFMEARISVGLNSLKKNNESFLLNDLEDLAVGISPGIHLSFLDRREKLYRMTSSPATELRVPGQAAASVPHFCPCKCM